MIEILILALAAAGTAAAGVWDLKTTEVPDEIFFLMIVPGIILHVAYGAMTGDFLPLLIGGAIGTIALAAGMLMFKAKQWGEADAWALAAVGYLVPFFDGKLFMLSYIPNLFLTALAYMIIYSAVLGIANAHIFAYLKDDIRRNARYVFGVPAACGIALAALMSYTGFFSAAPIALLLLIIFVAFFWRYAKTVEKYLFKKSIRVEELREGDVLEETGWVGITKEDVERIKKERKYVTIKEGVRFTPVFAIALVLTLLYGNLLTMLM